MTHKAMTTPHPDSTQPAESQAVQLVDPKWVRDGIADFIGDNWPIRKYTLAEIEAGIRVIEINPLVSGTAGAVPVAEITRLRARVAELEADAERWGRAVDGLGMLRVFLLGWKQSEACKNNQMEAEVQGWMDGISKLYRLSEHDAARGAKEQGNG